MSIITIVGSGMMGSALTFPARHNGNEVRLVGTHLDRAIIDQAKQNDYHITLKRTLPKGLKYYHIEDLEKSLKGADLLICGVSSFGVDWFAKEVLPHVPESLPVLSVTKGMVNTSEGGFHSYLYYYEKLLKDKNLSLNAIGGPCTSYELADLDQTVVSFCGKNLEELQKFKNMLETDYYHINLSTNIEGVECAVALKNAYALGVTLAIGIAEKKDGNLHYNSQAALFGQSVKEMQQILKLYDHGSEELYLGAGDLYVTVFGGRTRMIGTLLGKGYSFKEATDELKGVTLESLVIAGRTAKAVTEMEKLGKADMKDFPLLQHIDKILKEEVQADKIPWKQFTRK